jgi:aryl-alcohol dehydrogenase-like predicted oxidoreductase
MKYKPLGRTGMKVSRLCLGTANFGPYASEKEAFAIMDRALEVGINLFDTGNKYGGANDDDITHHGLTERMIGRWFAQGGNRREKVVLATKVYAPMYDETDGPNNDCGLSAYKIRRHLEGSLTRLQTDHIELYQMHHIDMSITWEECWGAFQPMVDQGKVVYVGSCNFGARHLAYAQAAAARRNFLGLVCEQHKYNLCCRMPELEVIPAARDLGIGLILWAPLQGGLLSGTVLDPPPNSRGEKLLKTLTPAIRRQLEEYSRLCRELGETEADVALAWLLSNPVVTAPLIGPRTVKQLDDSLRALEIEMTPELLKRLDDLFPGPGGEAPMAYAW